MVTPILIASIGMAPQVVTETVWALLNPGKLIDPRHRDRAPFVPAHVHLVATAHSRDGLERRGLADRLGDLMRRHGHPPPALQVDVPRDARGREIADIRTEAETIAYANHVTRLVDRYAARADTRLHVSLAGGRKTMTCYDHSALMVFGREQDELSHVLVEPAVLETCPDFWWPGQPQALVADPRGARHPTGEGAARIDLVPTPFLRLRRLLAPGALTARDVDYRRVVAHLQQALDADTVTLVCDRRALRAGEDRLVELQHGEFALYALLAVAAQEGWAGAGPDGIGAAHRGWLTFDDLRTAEGRALRCFLAFYDHAYRVGTARTADFDALVRRWRDAPTAALLDTLNERFTRLKSKLTGQLRGIANPHLRHRVMIHSARDRRAGGPVRFGLMLPPDQIAFTSPPECGWR